MAAVDSLSKCSQSSAELSLETCLHLLQIAHLRLAPESHQIARAFS
jgi:hypothetical protein